MVCRYRCPHLHQAVPSYAKGDLCIPLPAYYYLFIPYSCTKRYNLPHIPKKLKLDITSDLVNNPTIFVNFTIHYLV